MIHIQAKSIDPINLNDFNRPFYLNNLLNNNVLQLKSLESTKPRPNILIYPLFLHHSNSININPIDTQVIWRLELNKSTIQNSIKQTQYNVQTPTTKTLIQPDITFFIYWVECKFVSPHWKINERGFYNVIWCRFKTYIHIPYRLKKLIHSIM